MPPRKREKFKKFLEAPLSRLSRGTSPGPSRPTSSPVPSNSAIYGHTITAGTGTGSTASVHSTLPGPVHAAQTQPLDLKPLAPVPPKNPAFENAMAVILQNLSDDDKAEFKLASEKDVMEELRKAQGGTSRISGSLARVQKVLGCINRFMGPLGILIQHNPDISSLVVGGLSCILMVCILQITF